MLLKVVKASLKRCYIVDKESFREQYISVECLYNIQRASIMQIMYRQNVVGICVLSLQCLYNISKILLRVLQYRYKVCAISREYSQSGIECCELSIKCVERSLQYPCIVNVSVALLNDIFRYRFTHKETSTQPNIMLLEQRLNQLNFKHFRAYLIFLI